MTTQLQTRLREFSDYLSHTGYGKSTCYMLPECVKDFLEYHNTAEVNEFATGHINQYYEWLQVRPHKKKSGGLSEQYIHHHIYALKVFFNWLEETGQIVCNPMSILRFKSPEGNPRQPLSQEEIRHLFDAARSLKEKAVLHLFYSCGLRRSEGEALSIRDVHFKKQMLYVREGKGAKRRAVPMPERVSMELESYYLSERITLARVKDTEAFILNRVGLRMRGTGYNKLLKTILQRTELNNEITLHHLRHSIATHLLESGLELEKVRDFLGHSHLETTQIYTKIHPDQLKKL